MKRLTAGLAAIIALTVFACSTPEPERSSRQTDRPEPTVRVASPDTTSATPTLERITFQPTATPAPPIKTDSLLPTATRPPDTGPGETSWTDNSQVESDPHHTLIPDNPEFNESNLLRDIYPRIDMSQYALDPRQGIDWIQVHNCHYIERLRTALLQHIAQSPCVPESANVRVTPLDFPSIHPYAGHAKQTTSLAAEHYVLNTSPMNVIVNHPYRFAFKNTHLLAKHTNDEQQIRFAANSRRESVPGYARERLDILKNTQFKPPQGLTTIEHWLQQPWDVYHQPTQSLRGTLNSTVSDILSQADRSEEMDLQMALAEDRHHNAITLQQYVSTAHAYEARRPMVQWELVSPTLPIIRVTTYAEQRIPYLPRGQYLNTDHRDQGDSNHIMTIPVTRYAVSFVIAFQQRWDRFNQNERLQTYLPPETEYDFTADTVNRWYATDMMHHSIIGPVVVEVYESPVLEPGVYQKNPHKTTWAAPGYSDIPKNHKSYAHRGGRTYLPWVKGPPTNQMTYVDSSNDWYLALEYGYPGSPRNGYPFVNTPLPGHMPGATFKRQLSQASIAI